MCAAGRAARSRGNQVEAAGWQFLRRRLRDFLTLRPPFTLHHDRQAVNDDVQKTADQQCDYEGYANEQDGQLREEFLHGRANISIQPSDTNAAPCGAA
jgi:hypothetical protein